MAHAITQILRVGNASGAALECEQRLVKLGHIQASGPQPLQLRVRELRPAEHALEQASPHLLNGPITLDAVADAARRDEVAMGVPPSPLAWP